MAITTVYDGIEYRSRLEARWAAFMRNIGWDVIYEPFDGDGYIPDFLVQGRQPMLVEVKPAATKSDYEAAVPKAERGLCEHWSGDILIVGASPLATPMGNSVEYVAGWLGEPGEWDQSGMWAEGSPISWSWNDGEWFTCLRCKTTGVYHSTMTWSGRPCGHYDGNGYLGRAHVGSIKAAWADACNAVKWRGRAA